MYISKTFIVAFLPLIPQFLIYYAPGRKAVLDSGWESNQG